MSGFSASVVLQVVVPQVAGSKKCLEAAAEWGVHEMPVAPTGLGRALPLHLMLMKPMTIIKVNAIFMMCNISGPR